MAALSISASPEATLRERLTREESLSGQKRPGPSTNAMPSYWLGTHVLGSITEADPKALRLPQIAILKAVGELEDVLGVPVVKTSWHSSKP